MPQDFSIQINFYEILYEFSDLLFFFKYWYFSFWTKNSLLLLQTAGCSMMTMFVEKLLNILRVLCQHAGQLFNISLPLGTFSELFRSVYCYHLILRYSPQNLLKSYLCVLICKHGVVLEIIVFSCLM